MATEDAAATPTEPGPPADAEPSTAPSQPADASASAPPDEASAKGPEPAPEQPTPSAPHSGGGSGGGGRGKNKGPPTILGELNLKFSPQGLILPESYKTLKQRWRERRRAREARDEANGIVAVPSTAVQRRKAPKAKLGVLLDEAGAALFHAALNGREEDCRLALAARADPNIRSNADMDGIGLGATALHLAASRGHVEVIAELLSAGADATAVSGRGEAPLQLATRMGHVEAVRLFRDIGASPMDAEGALKLLQTAPSWDGRKRKRLNALLGPQGRKGKAKGKGKGNSKGKGKGDSEEQA